MTRELDNLVAIRQLKVEPASNAEVATLLQRATTLSSDAGNTSLAPASRFNLAYDAASALSAAHDRRNALAYSAAMSPSQAEVADLLAHTRALDRLVRKASALFR